MPVELKIPVVGESISEVVIGAWRKSPGERVQVDESVVELETDKATFDLPAPAAGVLTKILKQAGETAAVGDVIGHIQEGAAIESPAPAKAAVPPAPTVAAPVRSAGPVPEARREVGGSDGAAHKSPPSVPAARETPPVPALKSATVLTSPPALPGGVAGREERVVPMSPIRRRIAQRLVEAQRNAALLTTFNEIDMSAVIAIRKKFQEAFQEQYGVKLGFMSFFVKAVVEGLSEIPQLNAEVRG